MSIIIDLLMSCIVGAFIILQALHLNFMVVDNRDAATAQTNVQQSLVDAVNYIESDFRKIGYGLVEPKFAIAVAESSRIVFRADIDQNGAIDSVQWRLGPPLGLTGNPRICELYRKVNNGPEVPTAFGVTSFKLKYLTADGAPTSVLTQIWIIETVLAIESPYKTQDQVRMDESYQEMGYATSFWKQTRLATRNIKRHG
jgi:translation elongation factor EF-1beta